MCGYKRTLATPFQKLQIPVPNQIFSGQNRKPCDEKQLKKQPGDAAIKASSKFLDHTDNNQPKLLEPYTIMRRWNMQSVLTYNDLPPGTR